MATNHCVKVSRVIARRSRGNLTVLQDNNGEIAALPLVARNDGAGATIIPLGASPVFVRLLKDREWS